MHMPIGLRYLCNRERLSHIHTHRDRERERNRTSEWEQENLRTRLGPGGPTPKSSKQPSERVWSREENITGTITDDGGDGNGLVIFCCKRCVYIHSVRVVVSGQT